MMELKLSREPLQNNPNCAYCGKVFNKQGVNLQLKVNRKLINIPICQSCFDLVPLFEAIVNLENGYARINR